MTRQPKAVSSATTPAGDPADLAFDVLAGDEVVASARTEVLGMGVFEMKPRKETEYTVSVSGPAGMKRHFATMSTTTTADLAIGTHCLTPPGKACYHAPERWLPRWLPSMPRTTILKTWSA